MAFEGRVGDVGTVLRITVTEGGAPVDISSATTKQIKLRDPSGNVSTKTASFYSDGSDGIIQYTTVDGDLDEAGTWHLQAYLAITGWTGYSAPGRFELRNPLS